MPSVKVTPLPSPTSRSLRSLSEHHSPKSERAATTTQKEYENINVVKLISKAKFPVYLVYSPTKNQHFALKIFDYEKGEPHPFYKNEVRFALLNHPNVINIVYADDRTPVSSQGSEKHVSCIIMEYAPYGDLFDFVKKAQLDFNEKLTRTYFRQLIEGLEYLHKNGVCHLDIKLDNLLIGNDYQLKIADFDLSFMKGDQLIFTKGTRSFRAPELKNLKENITPAVDIYSAGIILFVMKCGGVLPYAEDKLYEGTDLFGLMCTNKQEFFKKHCAIQKQQEAFFSKEFKELFSSMVEVNPQKRATIKDIKNSKWYKGSVYTNKELKAKAKQLFGN